VERSRVCLLPLAIPYGASIRERPLRLVLVLGRSSSMAGRLPALRQAAREFVQEFEEGQEAGVAYRAARFDATSFREKGK
jgi:hypothetical protein